MIESAFSIIVAGLLGYWHALYAWVIGLSVLTAAFFLVSHKVLLRITSHNGNAADTASLIGGVHCWVQNECMCATIPCDVGEADHKVGVVCNEIRQTVRQLTCKIAPRVCWPRGCEQLVERVVRYWWSLQKNYVVHSMCDHVGL